MKPTPRSRIAMLLTMIYSLIIMMPLAPFAMGSAAARAVSGGCAGGGGICRCSPGKHADDTCCCRGRKSQDDRMHGQQPSGDWSSKNRHLSEPELSCADPCGDNILPVLMDADDFEFLPYRFSEDTSVLPEDTPSSLRLRRILDRHDDPPDHPPKLAIFS